MIKKITLLLCFALILQGCAIGYTKKLIRSGNYDEAIGIAVSNLKLNKNSKSNQPYIHLLENAFDEAKIQDLDTLQSLKEDANPKNLERIFQIYVGLNARQDKIRPLLPLNIIKEKRLASFAFESYSDDILMSKNAFSEHLYSNAKDLLNKTDKLEFRKAFDYLTRLVEINQEYKDSQLLLKEAKIKGTNYVLVKTRNETNNNIPKADLDNLLYFESYQLNDKWTIYHLEERPETSYDFGLLICFKNISISPHEIKEREFTKERRIKDGQKKLIDANGKEVLDMYGKVGFIDNLKDVRVTIKEFRQLKSCTMKTKIDYLNQKTNQTIQSFLLNSGEVFENIYATYNGDKRAADDNYIPYFNKTLIAFPSNETMIYGSIENLKKQIKYALETNPFKN